MPKPVEKTPKETKHGKEPKGGKPKPEQAGELWGDKLARTLSNGDAPKSKGKRRHTKEFVESIPDVSKLDPVLRDIARDLLQQAHDARRTKDLAEQTQKEATEQLAAIVMSEDWPGLRSGRIGILVNGYTSRTTFDKDAARDMLLDLGADPAAVGELYKKGDEYLNTRLEEFDVE